MQNQNSLEGSCRAIGFVGFRWRWSGTDTLGTYHAYFPITSLIWNPKSLAVPYGIDAVIGFATKHLFFTLTLTLRARAWLIRLGLYSLSIRFIDTVYRYLSELIRACAHPQPHSTLIMYESYALRPKVNFQQPAQSIYPYTRISIMSRLKGLLRPDWRLTTDFRLHVKVHFSIPLEITGYQAECRFHGLCCL